MVEIHEGTPQTMTSKSVLKIALALGSLLLCLALKLFLVRSLDIVDDLWDPRDYVGNALAHYWGAEWPPAYPPGTALSLQPSVLLGIPYRLVLEFLLFFVLIGLVACFRRSKISLSLAAVAALVVFFDPTFMESFDHVLSDNVSLLSTLCALSVTWLCLSSKSMPSRLVFSALAALAWGFTLLTRSLSELVFAFLGLCLAYQLATEASSIRKIGRLGYLRVLLIPLGVIAVVSTFKLINVFAFGFWGHSRNENSTYGHFYHTLERVVHDGGLPHFAIDQETRKLIYAASPSFAKYQAEIEKRTSLAFRVGREKYNVDDIPNGWTAWHFWQVIPGSYQDRLNWMEAVDKEVSRACSDRTVACRPYVLPGVDPRVGVWMPRLPQSLRTAYSTSFVVTTVERASADSFREAAFDLATARKAPAYMLSLQKKDWNFRLFDGLGYLYEKLYARVFGLVFLPLVGLCALALATVWFLRGRNGKHIAWRPDLEGLGLLLMFFCLNLLLYGVVDASGWFIERRYLIVNHALIPFIVCEALASLVAYASLAKDAHSPSFNAEPGTRLNMKEVTVKKG